MDRRVLFFVAMLALSGCGRDQSHPARAETGFPDSSLRVIKPGNRGVVLAWPQGNPPAEDRDNVVSLNQTLVVRVRNLDGWLIGKLVDSRISGEPDMTPKQRKNYVLLDQLAQEFGGALAVIRHYEADSNAATVPPPSTETEAQPAPSPLPESAAPRQPPPLPPGVTAADLRDAFNAYDALFSTLKRRLFLVLNNSHFRQLTAENPDARIANLAAAARPGDTIHHLEYRLRRRPGDEDAWAKLYDGTKAEHEVRVSLGVELDGGVFILPTDVHPSSPNPVQHVRLELYRPLWLWSTLGWLILLLALFIYLGVNTPLLRDPDLPLRADGCPQFSLSRLQLAFWTYLVVGAFLIIWLVTDRLDTLNATVLALLGISSGTTFASKLASTLTLTGGRTRIEPARAARRDESADSLRERLSLEAADLREKAAQLERRDLSPGVEAELAHIGVRIHRLKDDLEYLRHPRLGRFLIDLLSDNGRVTLHRMQIVIWTLVLGVVFVAKVRRELAMPTFSETLLGLMGLSSLTYIALKVPELKKVEDDVRASAKGKAAGKRKASTA